MEVMLVQHRPILRVLFGVEHRHPIWLTDTAPSHVECVFVAQEPAIEKTGVLVEEHGQLERSPAASLIDHHLAGFKLRFVAFRNAASLPCLRSDSPTAVRIALSHPTVRPEHGAEAAVSIFFEKPRGVACRNVVAVQEEHLLESAVGDGVGFDLPTIQSTAIAMCGGIHAVDVRNGFQRLTHDFVHLVGATIPYFDGKPTAQPSEQIHQDPGTGEIAATTHATNALMFWAYWHAAITFNDKKELKRLEKETP
ncbi:MAG: hypothetical protein QGH94_18705 [Phycisphaerae bacterium]|nr:hypothetical protein [Phycisphaerae bacterium]